jgi:hypothetical protein
MPSQHIGLTRDAGTSSRRRDAVERILAIDPTAPSNPPELARWLMLAHPDDVTRDDVDREVVKQERRIVSHHRVEGLVFPVYLEPTEDGGPSVNRGSGGSPTGRCSTASTLRDSSPGTRSRACTGG